MTRIAVNGAGGKMGTRILALAALSPKEFEIAGAFDRKETGLTVLSASALKGKGVLIDFSGLTGTPAAISAAETAGWGLVIGTTGLDVSARKAIVVASKKIPVVYSANMSVGVNLIAQLLSLAASRLGADYDIEITEAHHRHKKDSPSGTAFLLAQAIADAKKWDLKKVLKYRGEGKTESERSAEEIGMQVIRAGEIVGDHTVLFAGTAETIEITHRAQSRDTFAKGALKAAQFLSSKKNGLFDMADVLDLKGNKK